MIMMMMMMMTTMVMGRTSLQIICRAWSASSLMQTLQHLPKMACEAPPRASAGLPGRARRLGRLLEPIESLLEAWKVSGRSGYCRPPSTTKLSIACCSLMMVVRAN